MRAIRSKLSYSNVIATIALFLALGGGAAFAASKIKTSQIAKNAIKKNQLAKNSVTSDDFAKGALIVSTATGGPAAANVVTAPPATGTPLPLKGKTTFTPKKGAVGQLLAEVKGTLAAATPPTNCGVGVRILVNGEPAIFLGLSDVPYSASGGTGDSTGAPYTSTNSGTAPIGLTGGKQVITAEYSGSAGCVPAAGIEQLKIEVQRSR